MRITYLQKKKEMNMEINIPNLRKNLKEKNYEKCIFILHNKITELLTLEIQKYNKDFKYSNMDDLKNKCIK